MKKSKLLLNPLAVAVAIALPISVPTFAAPQLEEVIVTAQKREQSLQDVPVAVSAFSAADLASGGISDITELSKSSPNTTLEVSRGTNSTLTAFIRGIGQQDPLWGFEPGVGIYVDDVYFARPQGAVLEVYDVERIEILRGPQGTLYGKNTIGGAVKYVTRRMSGEGNASIKATLGSYQQRDLKLSVQVPVVDDVLYVGVSGALLNRDGYGWNETLNIQNGGKDIQSGRISFEYTPSEDLFIRLSYDETRDESNAIGPYVIVSGQVDAGNAFAQTDDVHDTNGSAQNDDGPGVQNVDSSGGALSIEYDVNESIQVKSISSYRKGETKNTQIDFDGTALPTLDVYAFYKDRQFSQELQLNYSSDTFSLVGGLFYYDGNAAGAFDAPILTGTPDPRENLLLTLANGGDVQTESKSAYVDGQFDITDRVQVYGGLRYTSDEKTANIYNMLLGPIFDSGFGCVVNGVCPAEIWRLDTYRVDSQVAGLLLPDGTLPPAEGSLNETYTDISPRIGVNFDITDDIMVYGGWSQGFKSGGFDMRANERVRGVSVTDGFEPEEVDAFELGMKGEFMDGRLRVNSALFYSDYKNLQAVNPVVFGQSTPVNAVENVGDATLAGLEIETTFAISDSLTLLFSGGYIDTSIDEYLVLDPTDPLTANGEPTLPPIDVSSQRDIQNTPEFTYNLKLAYDTEIGSIGSLNANIGYAYRDDVQMFETASPIDQEGYGTVDANIAWTSADERATVSLNAKNLTDKEYRVSGYNFGPNFNFSTAFQGAPRTVSLSFGYKMF